MHAAYCQLVLERGELHILTPGWPKVGGVGDFGQTTRVPLSGCRLSGYTVGGRAAAWAAASYNFPTVLLLLSLSCPGGAAAASKRLNFWMRSTTFWAVWVCGSSETNEGMGRGGLGVGVSAKWGLYRE